MLAAFIGQVLCSSEGDARCDDTLDGWVIGQVQEEHRLVHGPIFLKVLQQDSVLKEQVSQRKHMGVAWSIFWHTGRTHSCHKTRAIVDHLLELWVSIMTTKGSTCLKKCAVSMFTPMAAKTMANSLSSSAASPYNTSSSIRPFVAGSCLYKSWYLEFDQSSKDLRDIESFQMC